MIRNNPGNYIPNAGRSGNPPPASHPTPTPQPAAPANRPESPSKMWRNANMTPQDRVEREYYKRIAAEATPHRLHPDMPTQPAGRRPMTAQEASATEHFAREYSQAHAAALDMANEGNIRPMQNLLKGEFAQSYRPENGKMVPAFDILQFRDGPRVEVPSGFFPDGTTLNIHSHPLEKKEGGAYPSHNDHQFAFQTRTNQLHGPNTKADESLLFHPYSGKFYSTNGKLNGEGKPYFMELHNTHIMTPPAVRDNGTVEPVDIPIHRRLPPLPPGAPAPQS